MRLEALEEARDWLVRAERDLLAAQRLIDGAPPLPDLAAYHTQQSAEKALKGFLAANDKPFGKTHNLEALLSLAETIDTDCSTLTPLAKTLNPYATQFRYPGGPLEPTVEAARAAIELAQEVFDFVRARIPELPAE